METGRAAKEGLYGPGLPGGEGAVGKAEGWANRRARWRRRGRRHWRVGLVVDWEAEGWEAEGWEAASGGEGGGLGGNGDGGELVSG